VFPPWSKKTEHPNDNIRQDSGSRLPHIQSVGKENPCINHKYNQENESHPLQCIFSNIEIASIAMHATISVDILDPKKN